MSTYNTNVKGFWEFENNYTDDIASYVFGNPASYSSSVKAFGSYSSFWTTGHYTVMNSTIWTELEGAGVSNTTGFWINFPSGGGATYGIIYRDAAPLTIEKRSGGIFIYWGSASQLVSISDTVLVNNWNNLSFVYDGVNDRLKFYLTDLATMTTTLMATFNSIGGNIYNNLSGTFYLCVSTSWGNYYIDNWSYQSQATNGTPTFPVPQPASIDHVAGSTAGGQSVTITGTDFFPGTAITFGSTPATSVTVVNTTTITCVTPAHSAGTVNVNATNLQGDASMIFNGYTYNAPPAPTSCVPNSGTTAGGTAVSIYGTGFLASPAVTFGGVSATSINRISSTQINCNTPASTAGAVNVVVTNTDSQTGTLTNGYTYVNPATPRVISISPNYGYTTGGTILYINGINLSLVDTVTFGGNYAFFIPLSNTQIYCVTPAHASGSVIVHVAYGGLSTDVVGGFTYTTHDSNVETGGANVFVEKLNYCLAGTLTGDSSGLTKDGIHTHFNVNTGLSTYVGLSPSSGSIINDFGGTKTVRKINIWLYPQSTNKATYFLTPEALYSGAGVFVSYYDGTWHDLNWQSFNGYYALPDLTQTASGTYYSATGLISLYSVAGLSMSKIKVTCDPAASVGIGITEIEACNLIIANPTNIRVNELSDTFGVYEGLRVDLSFLDTDYSIYSGTSTQASAFVELLYRGTKKELGLMVVDSSDCDNANRLTQVELVGLWSRLSQKVVNKNAIYGSMDFAKVVEWLLACADIHRDLYGCNVPLTISYMPHNTDIQAELQTVLEASGDLQILRRDGLLTVGYRTSQSVTQATATAINTTWLPPLSAVSGDFNVVYQDGAQANLGAPIFGFSQAETYSASFPAWANGWLIQASGQTFTAGADLNHYNLTMGISGQWQMRGRRIIGNTDKGNYSEIWCSQFVFTANQGTLDLSFKFLNSGERLSYDSWEENINHLSVDTTGRRVRIIFYINYTITQATIFQYLRNEDTGAVIGTDTLYGLNPFYEDTAYDVIMTCNNGAVLQGVGIMGTYRRSYGFTISTPSAQTYLSLQFTANQSNQYYNLYSKTSADTTALLVANNYVLSAGASSIVVFFVPTGNYELLGYSYTDNGVRLISPQSASWTRLTLTSNIVINYLPTPDTDIENGSIQVYPRDLHRRKVSKATSQNLIYNELIISSYSYNSVNSSTIYDDEISHTISSTAYEVYTQNSQATDMSKSLTLYLSYTIGGNTYTPSYSLPQGGAFSYTWTDSTNFKGTILFEAWALGCHIKLSPTDTSFSRVFNYIKIGAYPFTQAGNNTQTFDNLSSQATYGIIQQTVSNDEVTTPTQVNLIWNKFLRFLSLPVEIVGDGVTTDLNIGVDLSKYLMLQDLLFGDTLYLKPYEYEFTMDITNSDYQMTIQARQQNYTQY